MRSFLAIFLTAVFIFEPSANAFQTNPYPEMAVPIRKIRNHNLGLVAGTIKDDPFEQENAPIHNKARAFLNSVKKHVFRYKGMCSAVFVSNTGYAVTALHCLDEFGATNPPLIIDKIETSNGEPLILSNSKKTMIGHTYDNINVNKAYFAESEKMKIVLMGNSYLHVDENWNDRLMEYPELLRNIRERNEDFAIVKFDKTPQGFECAPIAKRVSAPSEMIWLAGFPKYVESDLKSPDVLLGEASNMFHSEPWADQLKSLFEGLRKQMFNLVPIEWQNRLNTMQENDLYISVGKAFPNYKLLRQKFQVPSDSTENRDALYDPNRYFVSTAFSGQGMSGGGSFNTDGELNGLTVAKVTVHGGWYTKGLSPLTTIISLPYIVQRTQSILGNKTAAEIFDCF